MSKLPGVSNNGDDSLYCVVCKHLESRSSGHQFGQCDKCLQEELEMYDSTSTTSSNVNPNYDLAGNDDDNMNKSRCTLQSSLTRCGHDDKFESCQMEFKTCENLMLQHNKYLSMVGKDSFNFQLTKPCPECQLLDDVKKSKYFPSNESMSISFSSSNLQTTKKRRITWTEDLHKQFSECVNQLGGPKKATPKAIVKLMNCDGLTISNIKSHLQKYRVTLDARESSKDEDKTEVPRRTSSLTGLSQEAYPQILEALKMQISVQQSLYEQLEIQRNLQLRIEEQARQLRDMFDPQVKKISDRNFNIAAKFDVFDL